MFSCFLINLKERFVKYDQNFKSSKSFISSFNTWHFIAAGVRQNKLTKTVSSSGLPCSLSGRQNQFACRDDLGPGPDKVQGRRLHSKLNHELTG